MIRTAHDDESTFHDFTFSILLNYTSLGGLALFLGILVGICIYHIRTLFVGFQLHGYSHRFAGGILLLWLVLGVYDLLLIHINNKNNNNHEAFYYHYYLYYDIVLGCLGILTTLTAAHDFPHVHVKNAPGQSGTLDRHAIVTQSEMVEHSFYQGLNLCQSIYLHTLSSYYYYYHHHHVGDHNTTVSTSSPTTTTITTTKDTFLRMMALFCVTSPWLLRKRFPVHSFSANWKQQQQQQKQGPSSSVTTNNNHQNKNHHKQQYSPPLRQTIPFLSLNNNKYSMETILYQIKKIQYIFYKHFIYHGLNISMALTTTTTAIPFMSCCTSWRIFWICLNTSYVMEFFLQSLVKRQILKQSQMLILQRLLMTASSLAALDAISHIIVPWICIASLLLNLTNRHHDVSNTMILGFIGTIFTLISK